MFLYPGMRLPFDGGYWLVTMVSFDGLYGWRIEITPLMKRDGIDI